jgi:hypothetical protein
MDVAEKVSAKSTQWFPSMKEGPASRPPDLGNSTVDGKGFEILANVVWDEVAHAIMNDLGGIVFSAGRPDDFRRVRS